MHGCFPRNCPSMALLFLLVLWTAHVFVGLEVKETVLALCGINGSGPNKKKIIILSIKPQVVKEVVLELTSLLSRKKLLVSIAAGIKLKDLQEWASHGRIIKVMPNTPSTIGEAATVMSSGEMATKEVEKLVECIFEAIGKIWRADEKFFDVVTGLSGSGPAYIFLATEAMADGGVVAGLPQDLVLKLPNSSGSSCYGYQFRKAARTTQR